MSEFEQGAKMTKDLAVWVLSCSISVMLSGVIYFCYSAMKLCDAFDFRNYSREDWYKLRNNGLGIVLFVIAFIFFVYGIHAILATQIVNESTKLK